MKHLALILVFFAASAHGAVRNWTNTWNATAYSAGDTVNLYGTFPTNCVVTNSGTTGNPITFVFMPDSKLSSPTLPANTKFLSIDGLSNIVVDGGSNGAIELTDNGTLTANGGTHSYENPVTGIYGAGSAVKNITLQNLTIRNLYQRQTNSDTSKTVLATYIIGSDVTYSNLHIEGCQGGIVHSYSANVTSNLTMLNCTITNYNHAVEIGAGQSTNPIFLNVTIRSNRFESGDMFESPEGVEMGLHRNAIFIFNESASGGYNGGLFTGYISNIVVSHNFIRHGGSNPQSTVAGTGAMFFDAYNQTSFQHVRVFNNVSTLVRPLQWSGGGGMIAGSGSDVLVANNTAIGWQSNGVWYGSEISVGGTNAYLYNNIVVSSRAVSFGTFANTNGLTNDSATQVALFDGVETDYNIYNGFNGSNPWYAVVFVNNSGATWSQWFNDTFNQWTNGGSGGRPSDGGVLQWDLNSTTNAVLIDTNTFLLDSADTVAIGAGTNLTAWGITNDYFGNARPSTGAWDIGAAQYTLDETAPSVAITSPVSTNRWHVTLAGTASDNVAVDHVTVTVNGISLGNATGTTSWSITADLKEGENEIIATAFDAAENNQTDTTTISFVPDQRVSIKGILAVGGTLRSN